MIRVGEERVLYFRARRGHVAVLPLSAWSSAEHLSGVKREVKAVAAHLGLRSAEIACSARRARA